MREIVQVVLEKVAGVRKFCRNYLKDFLSWRKPWLDVRERIVGANGNDILIMFNWKHQILTQNLRVIYTGFSVNS